MKIHIKILILITIIATAFTTIACNNDLKPATTYYTVTFDSDGGSFISSQTVESGKTAVEPRSPTKSGYNFKDWYNGSRVFDFSTPITSDITLVAKWTKIQSEDNKPTDNDNPENEKPEENNNKTNEDKTPPAEVSNFTATPNHKRIVLNWTNPADEDFASVEITYADTTVEGNLSEPQIIQGNPSEQQSFTITNLENNIIYKITIKTIDSSNNKSTGVAKTASPKESKLSLEVSLPNDNGETVILTNDKATINVSISSTDQIVKAVWKKGNLYDAAALLSDETASILQTDSNTTSFTVNENGFYTIAVKNAEGITECIQTQIKTIDKNPLSEVTNLITEGDGQNIYVTWTNPTPQDKYDSPLKNVIVSYVYNDDESDAANGEITLGSGITTATIPIADGKKEDDFVTITVKVEDEIGNVNEGKRIKGFCKKYIGITNTNAKEKLESISENSTIIAMGDITVEIIAAALRQFQENQPEIRINLDLSQVESITDKTNYRLRSCTCLNNIKLPDSVTTIPVFAFSGCTKLETITIPRGVTSIGKNAFENCSSLTEITIPVGVTVIGDNAFKNCTNLEMVTIPNSVTNLSGTYEKYPFIGCVKLSKINFIGSVEDWCNKQWTDTYLFGNDNILPYDLYMNNQKVTDITIPNTVTNIARGAFYKCLSITNVSITEGVTSIEADAFLYCTNLLSITIPSNITISDSEVFYGCDKLSIINYTGTIEQWCSRTCGVWLQCPYDLYINNQKITDVEMTGGVTSISKYAFVNCSSLSSINISAGVTSIGQNAFYGCANLTEIMIPNTVTDIGEYAFYNCTGLTKITIPDSVINVEKYALRDCSNITDITLSGETNFQTDDFGDIHIKKVTFSKKIIPGFENYSCEEIYIKDNVTEIPKMADSFYDEIYPNLKTITIPSSVTTIAKDAFYRLKTLEKINYTGGIDQWCQLITFGEYWYSYLNPNGYKTEIYIDGNLLSGNLEIPEGIVNINAYAFYDCEELTSVKLPNSLRNIGAYTFGKCVKIAEINLGLGVKTIEDHAFYNVYCYNASITIPSSLCKIGAYALPTTSSITYTFVDTGTNWYNSETGVSVGAKPITAIKSGTGIHSSKYNGE